MPTEIVSTRDRLTWVFVTCLTLCVLIVLGTTVQNYVEYTMREETQVNFWHVARWPAIWWSGWVLVGPACFELAWRYPIRRPNRMRRTLLLIGGMVASSLLHDAWQVTSMALPHYQSTHGSWREAIEYHIITSLYLNVFIYWAVVGAAHGVKSYLRNHARAITAAHLETELATARLDVLRRQLHPHFLFNTLNAISAMMYSDIKLADDMVLKLSSLLRRALDRSDRDLIALGEELDFLVEYLAIEQTRFGEGLEVEIEVAEAARRLVVPTFVLQPLVENAIKHAIVPSGNKGLIRIRAQAGERLHLWVSDSGPGLDEDVDPLTSGVGLSNLKDRLDRLYGSDYRMRLRPASGGGLEVEIELPIISSL